MTRETAVSLKNNYRSYVHMSTLKTMLVSAPYGDDRMGQVKSNSNKFLISLEGH